MKVSPAKEGALSGRRWSTDEAMAGPTGWELWFAASGPPKLGDLIATGDVPALDADQEHLVSEAPIGGSGRYIYKAYQRPGHPGESVLWSGATPVRAFCGRGLLSLTPASAANRLQAPGTCSRTSWHLPRRFAGQERQIDDR
jgi:hypothetical protein